MGGGDSAAEEAVYLTKYASHVHLLVRKDEMRASRTMQVVHVLLRVYVLRFDGCIPSKGLTLLDCASQDRVLAHPNVTIHYNTTVFDAFGDPRGRLAGLHLIDSETEEKRDLNVAGLFYGIGHRPNSDLVKDQVDLTMSGYVVTNDARTSVAGVFACGDLQV